MKSGSKNVGTFGHAALISLIECKMKEQSEILLHAVGGLSLRLCQVESKTRQVEHSIEDLKDSTKDHYGKTEGKLRELENILREVFFFVISVSPKFPMNVFNVSFTFKENWQ